MGADPLEEAHRRLDAGDARSAHQLAERAYAASRDSGSPETMWRAAHLVGEALYVLGDLAGARVHAGVALRQSQAGDDPAALGADLNLLGVIEVGEGRLEEAVFLLRRSYDLRAQAGGPDGSDAIESLNNLAGALWRAGEKDEALRLHEDALERCERALGDRHRRTAETLNALAVKLVQGDEKAKQRGRELQERALVVAEAAQGPDSHLVGQLVANVAANRVNAGDHEGADPLIARALVLHERHYGPDSRWTAHVLHLRSHNALALGRHDEAREAAERALLIRVRELGPEDPESIAAATALWSALDAIAGQEAGEARDEASELERVCVALDPELANVVPVGGRLNRQQAADELTRIAARLEARRGSVSDTGWDIGV